MVGVNARLDLRRTAAATGQASAAGDAPVARRCGPAALPMYFEGTEQQGLDGSRGAGRTVGT